MLKTVMATTIAVSRHTDSRDALDGSGAVRDSRRFLDEITASPGKTPASAGIFSLVRRLAFMDTLLNIEDSGDVFQ
jgi:hypothetical protein